MNENNRYLLRLIAGCMFVGGFIFSIIPAVSYMIEGPGGPGMGIYGRESAIWYFVMDIGPFWVIAVLLFLVSFLPKKTTE